MALAFARLNRYARCLPHISSVIRSLQNKPVINALPASVVPLCRDSDTFVRNGVITSFTTIPQVSRHDSAPLVDILSVIESAFDELQGPSHRWVNVVEGNEDFFNRDRSVLVLLGRVLDGSTLEKVKFIQQRFPQLNVMGLLPESCADKSCLVEMVMKEYITFPILLSKKKFPDIGNKASFMLFNDIRKPGVYYEEGLDLATLHKAVEELNPQHKGNGSSINNLKCTWAKPANINIDPHLCSSLRSLLLHFPGCISANESSDQLFLSDCNHHRIIIFDGNGKILDCIGSSPGFEDGEFESAKLLRPAATFYDEDEDCLYIVDSENHAIRRADMKRRVLETLYPACSIKKSNSLWNWVVNKLGFGRDDEPNTEEFDLQMLMFPWHLINSEDNNFLIINRNFETLWLMDSASGKIKDVVKGGHKILEICGQLIGDKIALMEQIPQNQMAHQIYRSGALKGFPYASLLSSVTAFQDFIIICDMVGQRILKHSRGTGVSSNCQFSNFGVLGLPYWASFPLERVYPNTDGLPGAWDHRQHFKLLPGKIDIQVKVDIPLDMELVEQLQEGCIWCRARGAAAEVSGAESAGEKVGVAQQWYDDLDNLAFSTNESELTAEDENEILDPRSQEEGVHIGCAVNTSPGTSEVIICAALYMKVRKSPDELAKQEKYATRIAEVLIPKSRGERERDSFIQFLLESDRDLTNLIFTKPLHVRINLDTLDHPKVGNSKEIILTDSKIDVNVSL